MKMGAQIRTGKRLPDIGKRFRDRIWAYAQGTQLSALSEFSISIGKLFSGADLYKIAIRHMENGTRTG